MDNKSKFCLRRSAASSCHPVPRELLTLALLAVGLSGGTSAHAAGGHHAVEDAALLEPDQCQLETWWDREHGGTRTLLHIGPACRVGPVEYGLNAERLRLDGTGRTSVTGAQVKWARAIRGGWSSGVVLSLAAQDQTPRYLGSTVVVPVTWQTTETLLIHANVGRDFLRGQPDTSRAGLALEWSPLTPLSFVAEGFREGGASFGRAGVRWFPAASLNLDLSRARGQVSGAPAWWTLGLTWVLDR